MVGLGEGIWVGEHDAGLNGCPFDKKGEIPFFIMRYHLTLLDRTATSMLELHFITDLGYRPKSTILRLKAIIHFRNRNKIKVHRFTNNLQGLQMVMVKDFS